MRHRKVIAKKISTVTMSVVNNSLNDWSRFASMVTGVFGFPGLVNVVLFYCRFINLF